MKRTRDYIDDLAEIAIARYGRASDYMTAKLLNLTSGQFSHYVHGRSVFNDELAIKTAILLNLPPVEVLANIRAERAKKDFVRRTWEEIADYGREMNA